MPLATAIELRPLDPADLPRLAALQRRLTPPGAGWTEDAARRQLCDRARGGGAQVAVAWLGNEPVGFVGWVSLGAADGEFYGAPLVAANKAAARALLERLAAEFRSAGADWVRVSARPDQMVLREALSDCEFRETFDFITVSLEVSCAKPSVPAPSGLSAVPRAQIDAERFAELYNECFNEVANAPAITAEVAREQLEDPAVWPEGSGLWCDAAGKYCAFILAHRDGTIESVGVAAAQRRRGLGRALLAHTAAAARAARKSRLSAMIASTNTPSLRLHESAGFVEQNRRTVWQRG